MTVHIPDPLAAVCAYLRAQPTVTELLDKVPGGLGLPKDVPAVFRPSMPEQVDKAMPLSSIVVQPAGGGLKYGRGQLPIFDARLDLICYSSNQDTATRIARTAGTILKQLASPQEWEGVVLYACDIQAGPFPLPDQQTLWPACFLSVNLLHGEYPAPVL